MIDYNALIARVIKREGGDQYTNDPNDAGGPTKYGITLAALHEWRKTSVSSEDVRTLTESEAVSIYRGNYFPDCLTLIPEPAVVELLFDFSVNSGPNAAIRALQRVIKTPDDGDFGPKSKIALAKVTNWTAMFYAIKCERYELYMRYIGAVPSQAKYAIGWSNRSDQFEMTL